MPEATKIDERETPLGTLSLWHQPLVLDPERHFVEIRLNGPLLMSSGPNVSEKALATHCLDLLPERDCCEVLVGGLGLGYTAEAALRYPNVAKVEVVEFLPAVVDWHREGMLPLGKALMDDPRCEFLEGDFFAMIGAGGHEARDGGSRETPSLGTYDAILLDIDDSPAQRLHEAHGGFYSIEGLKAVLPFLKPGGVFGLWSFDAEGAPEFAKILSRVFEDVTVHDIPHYDETWNGHATHAVYVGRKPA